MRLIRVTRRTIELFGLCIHWYGVLIVLGMTLGIFLAHRREARCGLKKDAALDLALWCIPAAIIGARAYYVAFSLDQFLNQPWYQVLNIAQGGLAVYGGVLGGALAGWIYARREGVSFGRLADLAAPSIALGQAIGRWGNFLNQEAHGERVLHAALHFFPVSVHIGGEWYYATFFYESAWCFLIAIALLWAEKRQMNRRIGDLFLAYVLLYALERGVVEGMRADSLYIGALRVSQGLSFLSAFAISVLLALRQRRAPILLRGLAPAAVLAAVVSAMLGCGWGTAAAAATSLAAAIKLYACKTKDE